MKGKSMIGVALAAILAAGCGGSSNSGTLTGGTNPTGTPLTVGDAKISVSRSVTPSILDYESGISISAVAGTTISNFTTSPAPVPNNAPIYYTNNGVLYAYQRGISTIAWAQSDQFIGYVDVSRDGRIYAETENSAGVINLVRINLDGTGFVNLVSGEASYLRVSPDGAHLIFNSVNGLTTTTYNGTNPVYLDYQGIQGSISPDGTKVAYVKVVGSYHQVFTIPIGGGTPVQITSDNVNHYLPTFNPPGNLIFCTLDTGSARRIGSYVISGGYLFSNNYTPSVPSANSVRFSPDGKFLATVTETTYNSNQLQISTQDIGGASFQTLATGNEVSWPGYLPNRMFIGTTGTLFSSAAGVIYSQFQPGFASLVAFTATTPSTATVTQISTGAGPATYRIHADKVTGVKYVNGYFQPPVTIASAVADVLVTIDTTTGQVATVAPFTGAVHATAKGYTGTFKAVYNAAGKNLAPGGAAVYTVRHD